MLSPPESAAIARRILEQVDAAPLPAAVTSRLAAARQQALQRQRLPGGRHRCRMAVRAGLALGLGLLLWSAADT